MKTAVSEPSIQKQASLAFVMSYQFDPLVHRMVDKYGWAEEKSREVFEDLKRFLYLSTVSNKPIAPSEIIDEIWHNFILFTLDYGEFCTNRVGNFIHHRPRRRDDPASTRNIKADTLALARDVFGTLSLNWSYNNQPKEEGCLSCVNDCSGCTPSTNCQA